MPLTSQEIAQVKVDQKRKQNQESYRKHKLKMALFRLEQAEKTSQQ